VPVYQYACTDCGQDLEVRQSFTDDALTVCPACEGRLRKVLSAVGVVFKGSGFYRTDSRNGSSKPGGDAGADGKSSAEGTGSQEAGTSGKSGASESATGEKSTGSDKAGSDKKPAASDKSGSTRPTTKTSA
jgi:putative FmdB family regulatory protein